MAVAVAVSGLATPARADLFREIGTGLAYAGFNIEGDRNILSGGADFLINRNLIGNTLDFGATDLTVTGPISLSASYGGRLLDTFDIALRTAMDADAAAFPLTYVLNSDPGSQTARVSGTLFIDAGFSVNEFGFYDLDLVYSSRQNVETDGRFSDGSDEYDFDIGPINISGNIFADALALVTDPIFEATGTVNVFASFSGSESLSQLQLVQGFDALAQLASGDLFGDGALFALPDAKASGELGGAFGPAAGTQEQGADVVDAVIPEPTILVLLLCAAPLIFARPLRRRLAL